MNTNYVSHIVAFYANQTKVAPDGMTALSANDDRVAYEIFGTSMLERLKTIAKIWGN